MKKIAMLLVAVLSVTMLLSVAACGDPGYSKEGRLVVWCGDNATDLFNEIAKAYTEETGIEVVCKAYVGLSATEQLELDGPFGKGGDVYVQGCGGDLGDAVEKGLFLEVPADKIELDRFVEGAQDLYYYKGKNYGVALGLETMALLYNKDLISEIPDNWEDFMAAITALNHWGDGVKSKEEVYGFLMDISNTFYTNCILQAYGGYVMGKNADGTWNPQDIGVANSGAVAAYEMLVGLVNDKVIPELMDFNLMMSKMKAGKCAVILDGPWNVNAYRDKGINLGVAVIPDMMVNGVKSTPIPYSGAYGLAISSWTLNQELSMDFLKFATRPEWVLKYYQATGRIPSLKSLAENETVKADDTIYNFLLQMDRSVPQPNIPEMDVVWIPLQNMAMQVFGPTKADVTEQLNIAKSAIDTLIAQMQ